jgi:LuxR family transcriptional regulator, maltose regulon positive regulatory protein
VQQARGRLGAALKTYREGQRFATRGGRFLPFHAGEAHVGIARVLYARAQLDDALQHVTEGIELTRRVVEFRLPAFGLVNLAWTRQAMGDRDGALEAIDEACRLLPATDVVTMFSPAQTERAGLLLAQGRVEEAARWAEERGLTDEDDVSYPRERNYLVLTRVLLARHQPDRTFRLLKRLDALAESQGRVGSLIEIRALRSLALQSAGQHQDALTALAEVLALARPEGYIRVFADEGPPMAALLQRLIRVRQPGRAAAASRAAREHVNRVVQAFRSPMGRPERAAAVAMGPIEPLTKRELEVLGLIAAGRPTRRSPTSWWSPWRR